MESITIPTQSDKSVITCGNGAFEQFVNSFKGGNTFIVTDENVFALYGDLIKNSFPNAGLYVIKAGEKSKNYNVLLAVLREMISFGMTRASTVIAFGGGVVGDLAGLAASLYMRGVNLVQVPTTLLSQVDSSVGGKTAVDLCGVKNVIGSFYQPSQVVVDPVFLRTLPIRELRCGLGEIVKYGALNADIYKLIKNNTGNLFAYDFLEKVTAPCIRHKAEVVANDEHDLGGERKSLNLGHTTGHAFELRYKRKSHGEFVLIGAYYELFIAVKKGICDKTYADELRAIIKKVIKNIPAYDDATAAKYDKKNAVQTEISMIVPKCEGKYAEIKLDIDEYLQLISACAEAMRCNKW